MPLSSTVTECCDAMSAMPISDDCGCPLAGNGTKRGGNEAVRASTPDALTGAVAPESVWLLHGDHTGRVHQRRQMAEALAGITCARGYWCGAVRFAAAG